MSRAHRCPTGRRFQIEPLEGRNLLSQGLALTPTLPMTPDGAPTAPAEVQMPDVTPTPFVGVIAVQSLDADPGSTYTGGYSEILSTIVPIIRADGRTTGSVIWGRDASGALLLQDPVAVGYKTTPTLTYGYSLSPSYAADSIFQYSAVFRRTDGYSFKSSSFFAPGKQGELSLPLPSQVGEYTLTVKFTISRAGSVVKEQRSNTVYVLLNTPLREATSNPTSGSGGGPNDLLIPVLCREDAIQYAARWATGRKQAAGVLDALNQSIYRDPLNVKYQGGHVSFRTGAYGFRDANLYDYLDGKVDAADCGNLADMLSVAAALHGIPVGMTIYGGHGLVPGDHPPLSGVRPENRVPNAFNSATGRWDAWYNGSHWTVTYAGKYYDPTHGFTGRYSPAYESDPDRNWGENLLAYQGTTIPTSTTTHYLMKDGKVVGFMTDTTKKVTKPRFEYFLFAR